MNITAGQVRAKSRSTSRVIAANTTAQLLGKAITTAGSLATTVLIARRLGPAYYGDFTKAFVTATMFFMGIDFGINAIVVRRIARDRGREETEFRNALGARLLLALFAMSLLIVFLSVIPTAKDQGYSPVVKTATIIFALTFFEQAVVTTANSIFQARLEYKRSAIASAIGSLVILVGVWLAVMARANVATVALAYIAGSAVMVVISLAFVRRTIASIKPSFQRQRMNGLVQEAAPIGITLILNMATTRAGTILLALLRTTSEVGYWGLATRIFDVVLVLPIFFMNAAYPIMVQRWQQGPRYLMMLVKKSAAVLLGISFVTTFAVIVVSPWLAIIRDEFLNARAPLLLLSFSLPLFFLSALMQWTVVTMHRERALIPIYAVALTLSVIGNLLTIPRYGMLATAVTTGVTEGLILILTTFSVLQSMKEEGIKVNTQHARRRTDRHLL